MKTMAPDAPTSHTIARCKASTPGAAVIDGSDPPAVAAYAITHSRNATNYGTAIRVIASEAKQSIYPSVALWIASLRSQSRQGLLNSVRVLALGHQRQRR